MDEEEQKRQAASAAFAQAAAEEPQNLAPGYEDPNTAIRYRQERGEANAATEAGEMLATAQDNAARGFVMGALPSDRAVDVYNTSGVKSALWQEQYKSPVPGASEAFAQLDQASTQNPTQFDQASVAGLEPAQQQMVRENFDANLEAATRAVEEYAQGDDAFSRQAQRLLDRAERAKERQADTVQQPRLDPQEFNSIVRPDYSQMAQPDRSRAIRENARTGGQKFIPLTTPEDYQASALADLETKNGRDPFEF